MNKISIYGGLGNQMFQYAFNTIMEARGVSSRISLLHFFTYSHHHGFELSRAFNIKFSPMDRFKLFVLQKGAILWESRFVKFFLSRLIYSYTFIFEQKVDEKYEYFYDPNIFNVRESRLNGTWQSVKYLEGHESLLKSVFKFNLPVDTVNLNLSEKIANGNSVAVHIRRGDYLNSEWRSTHLVIDGPEYYNKAIDSFSKKLIEPEYYFFSDDMDWVKDNFKASNYNYVDHNSSDKSYLDMYLMSLCSNFIIPNSTFSWWAAWLSSNPDKEVICPDPWIKGLDIKEIYPENWIISKV